MERYHSRTQPVAAAANNNINNPSLTNIIVISNFNGDLNNYISLIMSLLSLSLSRYLDITVSAFTAVSRVISLFKRFTYTGRQ